MRPNRPFDVATRLRFRPRFEGLEVRALLSASRAAGPSSRINSALLQSLVADVYGPVTAPDGTVYPVPQPSAAEVRRETFVLKFVGNYTVTAPRSTDRADTIDIFSKGDDVGSNQFLKGRSEVLILPPANPNAQPDPETDPIAGLNVGLATFIPSNFLETSGDLMFDLTNMPGVASSDPSALDHGLPSQLYATLDLAGAGVYTQPLYEFDPFPTTSGTPGLAPGGAGGATAWTAGAGYLDLKYLPDPHPEPGTVESGQVVVQFVGLFNNPGDLNAINAEMEE